MKRYDFIMILFVIILSSVILINKLLLEKPNDSIVQVSINNELILEIKINEQTEMKILFLFENDEFIEYQHVSLDYSIPSDLKGYDLLYIYNNGIEVIADDSPNRIIAKQGFVNQYNYPLISVPRSLVIVIRSQIEEIGVVLS